MQKLQGKYGPLVYNVLTSGVSGAIDLLFISTWVERSSVRKTMTYPKHANKKWNAGFLFPSPVLMKHIQT